MLDPLMPLVPLRLRVPREVLERLREHGEISAAARAVLERWAKKGRTK
jgi:hypothetical protein